MAIDRQCHGKNVSAVINTTEEFPYCILASCYNQHGGRKDNTIILTNGQLTISTTSGEAHGVGENWHNRATTSGEYSITEDGRVRPKHVLIEFKK
jgi:hypothetical protein